MITNFSRLKPQLQQNSNCISIDQLLQQLNRIGSEPQCHILRIKSQEIEKEAKAIIRASLEVLVPDLCELEKRNKPDLKVQIAKRISAKLKKFDSTELCKIGQAIGIDSQRYECQKSFLDALSQKIRDSLHNPKDLAQALNTLMAGNLLKELAKHDSTLTAKVQRLEKKCLDSIDLIISLREAHRPLPVSPTIKYVQNSSSPLAQTISVLIQASPAKQQILDYIRENKGVSIFETIKAACNELALAAQRADKEKDLEQEQVLDREEDKQRLIEDFLNLHPEVKEILTALLQDRNFTDGPLTLIGKLVALDRANQIKPRHKAAA